MVCRISISIPCHIFKDFCWNEAYYLTQIFYCAKLVLLCQTSEANVLNRGHSSHLFDESAQWNCPIFFRVEKLASSIWFTASSSFMFSALVPAPVSGRFFVNFHFFSVAGKDIIHLLTTVGSFVPKLRSTHLAATNYRDRCVTEDVSAACKYGLIRASELSSIVGASSYDHRGKMEFGALVTNFGSVINTSGKRSLQTEKLSSAGSSFLSL